MAKFKDVDLNKVPEDVATILRAIVPEDADVEFDFSEQGFGFLSAVVGADDVKDDCSGMGCENCDTCPTEEATAVNLTKSVEVIANAYTKLVNLVRINGNVSVNDRQAAIDALGELINEGDYASALLEGDVSV